MPDRCSREALPQEVQHGGLALGEAVGRQPAAIRVGPPQVLGGAVEKHAAAAVVPRARPAGVRSRSHSGDTKPEDPAT